MAANLIEQYLTTIAETRGTGANVAETSFYPALISLHPVLDGNYRAVAGDAAAWNSQRRL